MKNNPYIGPRPYERGDRQNFFGRDRDARDLVGLILAEREVLFYAQSGAGKTSLLNAQVIPTLEDEGFLVLPVTRVGSSLPPELGDKNVPNIFVLSAMIGLGLPDDADDVDFATWAKHTLLSFLREYHLQPSIDRKRKPPLLIIDQFEELFTTHQDRWKDADGFFQQVRELLDAEPNLGIVLAMREDHVAEIDPFVRYLPRRLAARYRMERLRREEALEAVTQPALLAGCAYAPGVADRLVGDLSRIRVQRHGEAEAEVPGPVVEPVQLQVVCQRLWENLPDQEAGDRLIQWDEISQFGDIDRALTDFYEMAVKHAMTSGVSERTLRRWFFAQLITPLETRGLALRGTEETAGLPNAAVDLLENRHVIRADVRAGSIWYELSHDRLVEPIVQANRAWEAARQTPLRSTAQQWQQTKSASLLYRDKVLNDALTWITDHPAEVEPYEQSFLEASQQAQHMRARRRRWLITGGLIGLMVLIAMAALTMIAIKGQADARAAQAEADVQRANADAQKTAALNEKDRADQKAKEAEIQSQIAADQSQIALSRQLAAQANSLMQNRYDLAALLSVEALNVTDTVEARSALLLGFQEHPHLVRYLRNDESIPSGVDASSCNLIASVNPADPAVLKLTNAATGQVEILSGHGAWVDDSTFSPDCTSLTSTAIDNGTSIQWALPAALTRGTPLTSTAVVSFALGIDVSRFQGTIDWAAVKDAGISFAFIKATQAVGRLDANFTQNWQAAKAAGLIRGTYSYYDPTQDPKRQAAAFARTFQLELDDLPPVLDVENSGDLTNAELVKSLEIWVTELERQTGRRPIIYSTLSFLSKLRDRHLQYPAWISNYPLWIAQYTTSAQRPAVPKGWPADWTFWQFTDRYRVNGIGSTVDLNRFNGSIDDLHRFVQASSGNIASVNEISIERYQQIGQALSNSARAVSTLAFSPDNQTLASGSADGAISLWDVAARKFSGRLPTGSGVVARSVAFSPDGKILAVAGNDKQIALWDMTTRKPIGSVLSGYTDNVNSIAFSPDGRTLASGSCSEHDSQSGICTQGEVRFWDVASHKMIDKPIAAHTDAVFSVAFSPDGKTLASGGGDSEIWLWDVRTHQSIGQPLTGHANSILSLAFSPDGKTLASGSQDKDIRVWDVATYSILGQPLIGHQRAVYSVAFSPDGKILASGSWDKSIILWNVRTHQPIGQPLIGHTDIVNSVAFSPNGHTLASGGWDNRIILWDVSPEAWRKRACDMAGRNLTRAEWTQYIKSTDNSDPAMAETYDTTYAQNPTCPNLPIEPISTSTPAP
jgi:WD40 repeat protein